MSRSRRADPECPYQRFRSLPADRILSCLDTIVDVHELLGRSGEVISDFYDGCMLYDFAGGGLSLVDLDHYMPGPYHNQMGRMFGSTRFMAPEEFIKGSLIDQRTSVFTMGRTMLVLLSDGTLNPEAFHGPAPLLDVAVRACRRSPEERYGSLPEYCPAWREARQLAPANLL